MTKTAYKIEVKGLVQGVGFRPFIYKLARRHALRGHVENNNKGVLIRAEGDEKALFRFLQDIREEAPAASQISRVDFEKIKANGFQEFSIRQSRSYSDEVTEVSPDIAVCEDCLRDMKTQPHRIDYPFTNCTHCGPRFSIIKDLPYDRHQTTMAPFQMCDVCHAEYTDVTDRRFHAQPVACNHCGPVYSLHLSSGETENDFYTLLIKTAALLDDGRIVALKGLGGFHLACNALDENAVRLLRQRKNREGKPFAVMFSDMALVKEYLQVSSEEEKLLQSWRRPIVLLRIKKPLPYPVSNGLNTTGVMLPYMPFHYQLFEKLKTPVLVMTSGNLSDEPVLTDNADALNKLAPVADAVLTYNREIYNRVDDSVAMVVNRKERLIRRSRGYAPSSVPLSLPAEGVFAAGAELVNCFAVGKGDKVFLSQYIGDLKNPETLGFYEESYQRFCRLFRFKPILAAVDLHPDYYSTKFAQKTGLPLEFVQHHHAHIASCMAEHQLDEPVIGVSFDGTGLGTDGKIWGGEFLVCDLQDFRRAYHFEYVLQPGGDAVIRQPWRMALAYLYRYFGKDFLTGRYKKWFPFLEKETFELFLSMMESKINCPETSSAGRLFDAVSALLGICTRSTYHAEAPMRLESAADEHISSAYPVDIRNGEISFRPVFEGLLRDRENGMPVSEMAGKFHQTVVEVIIATAKKIASETGIRKVVLSGGTFQNRIVLAKAENRLREAGFAVYSHQQVPSNDGGIALGQMAVAAKRRVMNSNN